MFTAPTHPQQQESTRSRRNAFVFAMSTLAAVAVNALALAVGGSIPGPSASVMTRDQPSPTRALFVVPQRTPLNLDPLVQTSRQQATPPATPRVPDAEQQVVPPIAWAKSPHQNAPATQQSVRFFRLSEVDVPAQPSEEWNLDVESLDKLGLSRLSFEVLIDERGEVVGCTITDPPALAEELRNGFEERLRKTRMTPASRNGLRVASVRRIELFVTEQTP